MVTRKQGFGGDNECKADTEENNDEETIESLAENDAEDTTCRKEEVTTMAVSLTA